MTNVTNFPTPPASNTPTTPEPALAPRIWVCNCGCSTFNLREDGSTACALCAVVDDVDGGWSKRPTAQEYAGDVEPVTTVQGNGSTEFARRVIANRAREEDTISIVVVRESGRIHVWTGAETQEQAEWVQRRIADAVELAKWADEVQGE